ncbi:MAG: thiamine-phosphate kinase, partial [Candidatus Bathyarchaeia archaeon]
VLKSLSASAVPFMDDVAAYPLEDSRVAVVKTDMLVGKTDIPPGMTLEQAGRKAATMVVSDFAAKGVKPAAAVVALGLPRSMSVPQVRQLARGLEKAAAQWGFSIIGGDTNEADDTIVAVTLIGFAWKEDIVLRSTVQPGDLVLVTGPFGNTAAGLRMMQKGCDAPAPVKRTLLRVIYAPKPRLDVGLHLRALGASAAIDSSDGLGYSLHELSKASSVGFNISRMPLSAEAAFFAQERNLDLFELVFYGGEEYEIVFTMPQRVYAGLGDRWRKRFQVIGEATKERSIRYTGEKQKRPIQRRGWEHFKT